MSDYIENSHFEEEYIAKDNQEHAVKERNKLWIDKLLNLPQDSFVCVGVGHLFGPDSLINLMKQKGYLFRQATSQGFI